MTAKVEKLIKAINLINAEISYIEQGYNLNQEDADCLKEAVELISKTLE